MTTLLDESALVGDTAHLQHLLAALKAGQHIAEPLDVFALGGLLREDGFDEEAERLERGEAIDTEIALSVVSARMRQ